jgi:hypothetical protein
VREPCLDDAGDTAREMGSRVAVAPGRGGIARTFAGALPAGAGDGVSRLSVDDRFIEAYGFCCVLILPWGDDMPPDALSLSRAAAAGFGAPAAA